MNIISLTTPSSVVLRWLAYAPSARLQPPARNRNRSVPPRPQALQRVRGSGGSFSLWRLWLAVGDQGRWFKLWASAPADDSLQQLSPAHRWAWAVFGLYTKVHGTRGRVLVSMKNAALAGEMGVTVEDLRSVISSFPHMRIEESENPSHGLTVTWDNWHKYQEDTTMAARQRASRSKRRGDKEENKKRSPSPIPPPALFHIDPTILEAVGRLARFRGIPKLIAPSWWQAMIEAYPLIDHLSEMLDAHAWLITKGGGYRDMAGFLRNWFKRANADKEGDS